MSEDEELRRLLWFVLGGARGGENRARIIHQLDQRPMNLNQLADTIGVDYRTITHHAKILKDNQLVVTEGEKYGSVYFVSPRLQTSMVLFTKICVQLRFKLERDDA